MIKKINIENFKCYKKIDLEISKITLLTGANSSGKSSLLYSILGAIQSGEFPFQFSPNGKYIKMGDFEEIVYNHNKEKLIKLEFEISEDRKKTERNEIITTYWKIDNLRNLPILQKLEANSIYYTLKIEKIRKYNLSFEYFQEKDPNQKTRSPEFIKQIMKIMDINFDKINNDKKLINKYGKISDNVELKFSDIEELNKTLFENGELYYLQSIINGISKIFTHYDEKINYISSFRLYPERTYYETSKLDLKVGKFGENYEDQIIAWETSKSPKYKELTTILKDLGLLSDIKSKRLDGGRFEILIKSKENGIWSSLSDVGFGIS